MAGTGGKRPGAGRKSNAQRLLDAGFVCPFFGPKVQAATWKKLLGSDDERIVFEAAKYLTDRLYGKPKLTAAPSEAPAQPEPDIYEPEWLREQNAQRAN